MESTMNVPIGDAFETLMEVLEVEYRKALTAMASVTVQCDDDVRKKARDKALAQVPELEHCHRMHGKWYKYPADEQPTAALLGRRVAGLLWRVWEEFTVEKDFIPEKFEPEPQPTEDPPEPDDVTIQNARWATRSKYRKSEQQPSLRRCTKYKYQIVADSIRGLKPGWEVDLNYSTEAEALADQALLGTATEWLGWNHDTPSNTRSYSSSVDKFTSSNRTVYILTVRRLKVPRPTKRKREHG